MQGMSIEMRGRMVMQWFFDDNFEEAMIFVIVPSEFKRTEELFGLA